MLESTDVAGAVGVLACMTVSLAVHESAHAWTADRLGDPTGRQLGRVSLNPFVHLDLFLSVLLPLATYWAMGVPFGAAKPVPVNVSNLGRPRRDWMLVALAGPLSNLALAALAAALWWALRASGLIGADSTLHWMFRLAVVLNVVLAMFNLIPIPTLDGSRVVGWLLPRRLAWRWYELDRAGFVIVLALLVLPHVVSGVDPLGWFVRGAVDPILGALHSATGLPTQRS
ncbi:MAG TPA: site-2 protease family protein [Planctomycetota bacterium]|nr:site-2 protease family protein [Planctomycetota bacterium]